MKLCIAVLCALFFLSAAGNDLLSMRSQYLSAHSVALEGRSAGADFVRKSLSKVDPLPATKTVKLETYKPSKTDTPRSMRVCVVLNTENKDALLPLAVAMSAERHTVQILLADSELEVRETLPVERLLAEGELQGGSAALKRSFAVYQYLSRAQEFDIVISTGADAYYSMLARSEGLAFRSTQFLYGITKSTDAIDASIIEPHKLGEAYELRFMSFRQRQLADWAWSAFPALEMAYVDTQKTFFLPAASRANFVNFVATRPTERRQVATGTPLVTVCIVHYNRPSLLLQAVDSVLQQTYKNTEVVIVDNGSNDPEVPALLNELESRVPAGWQVVRSQRLLVSAAKNLAADKARGDYILFLDDDNLLKAEAIETYVRAALNTDADVLSAPHDVFTGDAAPVLPVRTWLPLGPSAAVGMLRNCFGDSNFFVRRSAFQSIRFTEENAGAVSSEDHEFFVLAQLSGYKLQVVPAVLLWRRMHSSDQLTYVTSALLNNLRALRPYAEKLGLGDVVKFLATMDTLTLYDATMRVNCTNYETACGSSCCNLASHHCDHVEKTCKLNPFNCPADTRHIFCRNIGRCVPMGGIDGHGRTDCGACGLTCDQNEVCVQGPGGFGCAVAKEIRTDARAYEAPTVVHNEDGSLFVDAPEIEIGSVSQGEERAFLAPEHAGFNDITLAEDEVLQVRSTICLSGLAQGDKFRVHALPVKKAVKATAINAGGSDLTVDQNCVQITSSAPVRSVSLQRIGSPRRVETRSPLSLKMHQTARAVRTAEFVALQETSSQDLEVNADTPAAKLITVINFNFGGTLPNTICATKA